MIAKPATIFAIAWLLGACAADAPVRTIPADPSSASSQSRGVRMTIVESQDVSGRVFKRLGLPNQDYCWQQCLQEERCLATRWGVIAGATAGQCQLLSGDLTFGELREIKTSEGDLIVVTVSRKEASAIQ